MCKKLVQNTEKCVKSHLKNAKKCDIMKTKPRKRGVIHEKNCFRSIKKLEE